MDEADLALHHEELARAEALRHRKTINITPGRCGYCDEEIAIGSFCDVGCRDDFERITKVRA